MFSLISSSIFTFLNGRYWRIHIDEGRYIRENIYVGGETICSNMFSPISSLAT